MRKIILCIMIAAASFGINSLEMKHSDKPIHNEAGVYEDDYMFSGKSLLFTGKADDLFFGGEKLDFEGETKNSLSAFGSKVVVGGKVGNDMTLAGSKVTVRGGVNGTVFAAGEDVVFDKSSVVNGTIFAVGGTVTIKGQVTGDVYVGTGKLIIDGTVNGNIKTNTGFINFGDLARVNGDFTYTSDHKLKQKDAGAITGKITFKENKINSNFKEFRKAASAVFIVFKIVLLISFILGGLLLLLFPISRRLNIGSVKNFWKTTAWGLIPFFMYPAITFAFLLPLFTFSITGLFLLAGLPLLFITQVLGVTLFGQMLFRVFKWKSENRFLWFLFGSVFFAVLSSIPGLCIIGAVLFSSAGWGVIVNVLFDRKNVDSL